MAAEGRAPALQKETLWARLRCLSSFEERLFSQFSSLSQTMN
jgi:hypothetical protein